MITIDRQSIENIKGESHSVWNGKYAEVYLNGRKISDCIYCNIDAGIVIVVKRTVEGGIITDDGNIVHEILSGDVTVKPLTNREVQLKRNHTAK